MNACLTEDDKAFMISLTAGEPDWSLYPIPGLEEMSAVKWKLLNIQKLVKINQKKHDGMLRSLQKLLAGN